MTKNRLNRDELRLFPLTWPLFIEIFLHMLLGNADTFMLSQYSDSAVAAVGVSNQIISMVIIMYGVLSTGTAILVSQYLGADKYKKVNEIVSLALIVNLIFGLILSLGMTIFSSSILNLMRVPEDIMDTAKGYLIIVGGFSFIQAIIMTVIAIVRSHGLMKVSLYVTIGTNIVNVIGNYIFIFGPFGLPILGARGVAISTTFSRTLGLIVMFYILIKALKIRFSLDFLKPFPRETLKNLLKIGIPTAGEQLSYNVSQIVITSFITVLGTRALTTKYYAQNLMMFIFLFSLAIGQATQIIVGRLVGAGKKEEAYKACLRSFKIALVISLLMAVIFSLLSKTLLGILTDDIEIIRLGSILIVMTIILEPGRTFNLVIINALRGAGDVKFPVYMGLISMWGVSVVLSYLLGIRFGLGLIGMWIAFSCDEWFRGLLMLWRWKSRKWEKMAFVSKED